MLEDKKIIKAIGIDGCRQGWVIAYRQGGQLAVSITQRLDEILSLLMDAELVCIDMPMGLPDSKEDERECDRVLRNELGFPFSSSVFNVPCRKAVYAATYGEANELNKKVLGKGISKQSWNICNKIKELDDLLQKNKVLIPILKECHPELCFKQLNSGLTLQHKKKTSEGIIERKNIISQHAAIEMSHIERLLAENKKVLTDDILDAIVLAITGEEMLKFGYTTLPDKIKYDSRKIPMAINLLNQSHVLGSKNRSL